MDFVRIIAIGLVGGVLSVLIRNSRPEFSMFIPAVVSFTIIFCALPYLKSVLTQLKGIADGAGLSSEYLKTVIKIIGVSYIASISAELCKDAGEGAIASKIELGGKLIILGMSAPIIGRLLNLVREIIYHS